MPVLHLGPAPGPVSRPTPGPVPRRVRLSLAELLLLARLCKTRLPFPVRPGARSGLSDRLGGTTALHGPDLVAREVARVEETGPGSPVDRLREQGLLDGEDPLAAAVEPEVVTAMRLLGAPEQTVWIDLGRTRPFAVQLHAWHHARAEGVATLAIASLGLSLLLALSVLAGCMSQGDGQQPAKRAGCGSCTSEVGELAKLVAGVPGVAEMKQIRYTERVAVTTPATLTVVVAGEDQPPLRDAVAKAAWLSEVTPLEDLSVGVLAPGAKYVEYHDYAFERDADSYAEKWGPRPGT